MIEATDSGPLTPTHVRWLKIAVVVMGIMIIVGIAILFGRVLYLASSMPRQGAVSRSMTPADARLVLPTGASVRGMALSGDRLAVHYDGPRGSGILVLDLATGAQVGRFDVVPEVPR
jgi:hypothetical protein